MTQFIPKNKGPAVISGIPNSNAISDAYRDSLLISYDFIGEVDPDTTVHIFGRTFAGPVFAGPIGGANNKEEFGGVVGYARAVQEAGSLYYPGFHDKEEWKEILKEKIPAARVIKPLKDIDAIIEEVRYDTENGAVAYAMDISHGKTFYGEDDAQEQEFKMKTKEDLIRINEASPLPFILKDVQSMHDVMIAKEAGVAGIWLSGHNNRYPYSVPPLFLLPKVREAVGQDMTILIDGGLSNGYDAFKALALGADAVVCARSFMAAFLKEGQPGLTYKIQEMNAQLKGAMAATGSPDLEHINRDSIIRIN